MVDILESMGCQVYRRDREIEIIGGELHGVEVDMNAMPDVVPTLAVVAAFARGTTRISRVGHLQYKETDRIAALRQELAKMRIETYVEEESLIIKGGSPQGAEIDTYQDHRMAMAFAVAGLKVPGVVIQNPDCVNKSFPAFWTLLEGLG